MGEAGGAVALPKNPIRTLGVERTSPREEWAGKAGGEGRQAGQGRREAPGAEGPGGPGGPRDRAGPGRARGSNPTPGPPTTHL